VSITHGIGEFKKQLQPVDFTSFERVFSEKSSLYYILLNLSLYLSLLLRTSFVLPSSTTRNLLDKLEEPQVAPVGLLSLF